MTYVRFHRPSEAWWGAFSRKRIVCAASCTFVIDPLVNKLKLVNRDAVRRGLGADSIGVSLVSWKQFVVVQVRSHGGKAFCHQDLLFRVLCAFVASNEFGLLEFVRQAVELRLESGVFLRSPKSCRGVRAGLAPGGAPSGKTRGVQRRILWRRGLGTAGVPNGLEKGRARSARKV